MGDVIGEILPFAVGVAVLDVPVAEPLAGLGLGV